jgi:twitching motility two-component system response regulator PilG
MTRSILIIDDSVCVRTILNTTLRRVGYLTMSFAEGYDALRWLASEKTCLPALIILDLTLPKMDGYTVLRHLRKRAATAHTPVVILSGRAGVLDRLKGRLAGANAYLTKPFHQQAIIEVVRAQLAQPDAIPGEQATETTRPKLSTTPTRAAVHPITLRRWEG